MPKKVLLGFSGGMDSCASAMWLMERGYDVTAVTMDMTGDTVMLESAGQAARRIGIKWMTEDMRASFKREVKEYFIAEYMRGATPSPCVICNTKIKWAKLFETAFRKGFDHIATGHYFRTTAHNGRLYVTRAMDEKKDQSYYLWGLGQEILSMVITPMGECIKADIKKNLERDLSPKESMGICFLNGKSIEEYLRSECGQDISPGDVTDRNGRIIAGHRGYPFYTIGQRRGFPGPKDMLPRGMAVTGINAKANTLTAGGQEELLHNVFYVKDFHTADIRELTGSNDISVKIRGIGRNPEGFVHIYKTEPGILRVQTDTPVWAPSEGQPAVFYRSERVVGGGFLSLSELHSKNLSK